jgi:hypothetical protein
MIKEAIWYCYYRLVTYFCDMDPEGSPIIWLFFFAAVGFTYLLGFTIGLPPDDLLNEYNKKTR